MTDYAPARPAFRVAFWFASLPLRTLYQVACHPGCPQAVSTVAKLTYSRRGDDSRPLSLDEIDAVSEKVLLNPVDEDDALRIGLTAYYSGQIVLQLAGRPTPLRIDRCQQVTDIRQFAQAEAECLAAWKPALMQPVLERLKTLGVDVDLLGPPWPTPTLVKEIQENQPQRSK